MNPEQYVQQKAAASGSSFYYAFLFLPKDRRAAITAFYAFCREVDDVVDEVTDPGVAGTKLAWWQTEVGKAFAGNATHPVMRALMPWTAVYGIEARHLQFARGTFQNREVERLVVADDPRVQHRAADPLEALRRHRAPGGAGDAHALHQFRRLRLGGAQHAVKLVEQRLQMARQHAAFVQPGRKFVEVSRTKVDPFRSTPIFDGEFTYLRTQENLRAFRGK